MLGTGPTAAMGLMTAVCSQSVARAGHCDGRIRSYSERNFTYCASFNRAPRTFESMGRADRWKRPPMPARIDRSLSQYLDFLRLAAALSVFAGHIATCTGYTSAQVHYHNAAVMMFFVLSGYVIAHTVTAKPVSFAEYAIARLARLWSVALPALAFSLTIWVVGPLMAPRVFGFAAPGPATLLKAALASVTFINESSLGPWEIPADWPFWSLSYEFTYYLLFGTIIYTRGQTRTAALAVACGLAGPRILLLLPIWILGVIVYKAPAFVPARWGYPLLLGSAGIYSLLAAGVGFGTLHQLNATVLPIPALMWSSDTIWKYLLGIAVAANIAGFAAISHRVSFGRLGSVVSALANGTFALYLFHAPLILLLNSVLPQSLTGMARVGAIVVLTLLAVALIVPFTEQQKGRVRYWLTMLLKQCRMMGIARLPAIAGPDSGVRRSGQ